MLNEQLITKPSASVRVGAEKPEVEAFLNYREFLKRWIEYKKSISPSFSGAVFAKKAKIKSQSLLGMVARGERNLSYSMIQSFLKGLELTARESKFFEKLVLYNQATSGDEKAQFLKDLGAISTSAKSNIQVLRDYSEFVASWYIVAIRELVVLPNFSADPIWISKSLKNAITPKQAEKAWSTLLRLNFVKLQGDRWILTSGKIDIDPKEVSLALREFYKSYLDRARLAIDHEPMDERELGFVTIAVNEEEFEVMKERIRKFRLELNEEFGKNHASRNCVISVNFQAIQLTAKTDSQNNTQTQGK